MTKLVTFITFISFLACLAFSQSTVKTLPGYSGNLPFKLETGYITVGENEEVELFYYFIESERNPNEDPLLLWLTGGPGCSGLNSLAFDFGPIAFDVSSFNGSLPSLIRREQSWTKIANVIFIDSPVGTGFSYATQTSFYNTSDTLSAKHTDTFFRKCFNDLNIYHILERVCPYDRNKKVVMFLEDDLHQTHMTSPQQEKPFCRDEMNSMVSYVWGNDPQVRNALHVRNGTIKEWRKCNTHLTSAHKQNVASAIPYHQFLSQKISKALVYRYTQKYKKDDFSLTFATVKGAGHSAPEYKPEQSLAMVDRWISSNPL